MDSKEVDIENRKVGSLGLFVFGLIGLSITCLQGLAPIIELSKLVKLLIDNWLILARAPWHWLSGFFGISLPTLLVDFLNSIVFSISFIRGCRYGQLYLYDYFSFVFRIVIFAEGKKLLNIVTTLVIMGPLVIIIWLLSFAQWFSGLALVVLVMVPSGKGWRKRIANYFYGDIDLRVILKRYDWFKKIEIDYSEEDNAKFPSYLFVLPFMGWGILSFVMLLLAFNFLAINSSSIENFIYFTRCDAGIEC